MDDLPANVPLAVRRALEMLAGTRYLTELEYRESRFPFAYSRWSAQENFKALWELAMSPKAGAVWQALALRGNVPPRFYLWLSGAVPYSLRAFEHELRVAAPQRRAAASVASHAARIAELLEDEALRDSLQNRRVRGPAASMSSHRLNLNPAQFRGLAVSAQQLSQLQRTVSQPNAASARRVHFMRELTALFAERFHTPSRRVVLALSGVYFDVGDLTPNDVAKIAPVKKAAKNGNL